MQWLDASEVVFGALLKGTLSPQRVQRETLHPPYDRGHDLVGDKAALVKEIGVDAMQSAMHSITSLNGTAPNDAKVQCEFCQSWVNPYESCPKCGAEAKGIDWVQVLEESFANYQTAEKLKKYVGRLEKNEPVDFSGIQKAIQENLARRGSAFVTLDQISDEQVMWKSSGIKFIDDHIGGYPQSGVVNIAGRPKVGKTTLIIGMVYSYVKAHPDENVAVFSLEMSGQMFKYRFKELYPDITPEEQRRIKVTDGFVSASKAIAMCSSIPDLGVAFMDFADLMVSGEVTETQTTALYRTLANGSKELNIPVILISQLSGSYTGGIPRPFHIRYSRLIEALVVMNLMLYVPWNDYFELKDADTLPPLDQHGYVIKWFCRYGTSAHSGEPGAILVEFEGASGWNLKEDGRWVSLAKLV